MKFPRINHYRSFIYCLSILMGCFLLLLGNANARSVEALRVAQYPQKTRIVLEISTPFTYRVSRLHKPERVLVTLSNTQLNTNLKKVKIKHTAIKRLNRVASKGTALKLVFELNKPMKLDPFVLKPSHGNAYRLVLDLTQARKKSAVQKKKLPVISVPKKVQPRLVTIVIDPGHGGKDPGAIGRRRTKEKHVVLAIAKVLQKKINQQPGLRAVLTRKGDYYLSLRQRLRIARKNKADLFIAIHADAYRKMSSHGASVYALSQRGASSEAARWLAARENHSELGKASLIDKGYILRSVLIDLSQTATINSSLQLGQSVLKNIGKITPLHNHKVEQAGFVVLKSPDIPSILIETGFISNPTEELSLRNPRKQAKLSAAITQGIKNHFWRHPPERSIIAVHRAAKAYKVRSGDTLIKIAKRYRIPLHQLKRFNHLSKSTIFVGQVIRIPVKSS